jgi:hypothetical protein
METAMTKTKTMLNGKLYTVTVLEDQDGRFMMQAQANGRTVTDRATIETLRTATGCRPC